MEIVLGIATILGGIAAVWYFYEKFREKTKLPPPPPPQPPSPNYPPRIPSHHEEPVPVAKGRESKLHSYNDIRDRLTALNRDELNIVARKLRISGFRKKKIANLIADICSIDEDRVRQALSLSWRDKHQRIITFVDAIIVALVTGFIWWRWPYTPIDHNEPVLISPATMTIANDGNRNISVFHVRNRSDQYIYQVTTKLTLYSDFLTFSNLLVSIPTDEKDKAEYVGMATNDSFTVAIISKCAMALEGRDRRDPQGKPAMLVFQDHLPPGKGYSIQVEIPSHVNISTSKHTLACSYVSSTNTPSQVQRRGNSSDLWFWGPLVPAYFTVQRVHVFSEARAAQSESGKAFNQGVTNYSQGLVDAAFQQYSKAIELNPKMQEAYFNRAGIYERRGATNNALADYRMVTNLCSSTSVSGYAFFKLGLSHYNQGNTPSAIPCLQETCRLLPDFPEGHFYLAILLATTNPNEDMALHWDKALKLKPSLRTSENAGTIADLQAIADTFGGREGAAIDYYSKVINNSPRDHVAHINRAATYLKKGEIEKAMADYRTAITIAPSSSFSPYYNLGMFEFNKGNMKSAIPWFQESCKLNSEHPESHFYLAISLGRSGRISESAPHLETALKLKPSLAVPLNLPVESNRLAQPKPDGAGKPAP